MSDFRGVMFERKWPLVFYANSEFTAQYPWPDDEYRELAKSPPGELADALLCRVRENMNALGSHADRAYPSCLVYHDGLAYKLGDGGAFFSLLNRSDWALYCHNLDFAWQALTAFNTASDAVELLKPGRLAPRVVLEGRECVVRYFLPGPFDADKLNGYINSGVIERNIFPYLELDAHIVSLEVKNGSVRLDIGKEVISIGGDVCEARGFNIHDAHKATSLISSLFYELYKI